MQDGTCHEDIVLVSYRAMKNMRVEKETRPTI